MVFIPYIVAASGLFTLSTAVPVPSALRATLNALTKRATYNKFGGDGTMTAGWPDISEWVSSFDEMFDLNLEIMQTSCKQWGVENNSDGEIEILKKAIPQVASEAGLDARFLLAIAIQESNACVRAPTTDNGVVNPGILQAHNGAGSCNKDGNVQNPCPEDQIVQMLRDGAAGTAHGDGLEQLISSVGSTDTSKYYKAARKYNSGSIAASGNLGDGITSTFCYASDVANRLVGWVGASSRCDAGSIATLSSSEGNFGNVVSDPPTTPTEPETPITEPEVPAEDPTPAPEVPETTPAPETPEVPETPETPSTPDPETPAPEVPSTPEPETPEQPSTSTPSNAFPGALSNCSKWHLVTDSEYCELLTLETGITQARLMELNPGLDERCSNLWLGYDYCVGA